MEKLMIRVCLFQMLFLYIIPYSIALQNPTLTNEKNTLTTLKINLEQLYEKGAYGQAIIQIKSYKHLFKKKQLWKDYVESTILLSEFTGYNHLDSMLYYADLAIAESKQYQLNDKKIITLASYNKAIALFELDQKEEAVLLGKKMFPTLKEIGEWKKVVEWTYYLSLYHYQLMDYDLAKNEIKKGIKIGRQYQIKSFETFLLNLKSVINYKEGDFQLAIQTTLQIIKNQEKKGITKNSDKVYLARNYRSLGTFYSMKGELDRALDAYIKVSLIFDRDNNQTTKYFQNHFNDIGRILNRQKKYKEAIVSHIQTIALIKNIRSNNEKNNKSLIDAYNEIAANYYFLENPDSVIYYANKALAIDSPYKKYYSYFRLGQASLLRNNGKKAIGYIKKSMIHYEDGEHDDNSYLVNVYKLMSMAYRLEEDYQKSLQYIQKSIAINQPNFNEPTNIYLTPGFENIAFPREFLDNLQYKAQLFTLKSNTLKDQQAALETYQLATQWIDSLQQSYVLEGSQLFWSNKFKEVYEEAIVLNHQFYKKTGDSKYLKTAFDLTEKSKALLLLEGLKDNEGQHLASLPDSLTKKEKDLKIAVAFYEKSLQIATEKKQEDRIQLYQSYLANNRLELARLKEQMEADYPTYYALKYANTNISIEEVQTNILSNEQVFINYFLGKQKSYAFVVGKDFQEFIELAPINTIQTKGQAFLQLLKTPSLFQQNAKLAFQNYNQAAFSVYQLVFEQISTKIPATTDQLIISPDGILNQIPFAALTTDLLSQQSIDFGQLPYLLHRHPIHYAYSANLLWNNRQKQQQSKPIKQLLAYAPSYQSNGQIAELRGGSADLVGTKTEIQAIAKYFKGIYQNNELATKNHFQANAANYGLLHLAMHGEGNSKTGSHLIFTDQNQPEKEAHFLHDYEIANMDLTAQLAVLSACETGIGEYVDGEGVFSLARSFMYAGVPSIAMSLWQVNDLTTSQIMPEFYKNLAESSSKATSLHQAKQSFLATAGLEYRHPYYWSGFVLLGDGQALKMDNLLAGLLWGIGLAFMLIGAWGYFRSLN